METRSIALAPASFCLIATRGSGMGATSSLFWPRNGYLSCPVPPLSARNIGVAFGGGAVLRRRNRPARGRRNA